MHRGAIDARLILEQIECQIATVKEGSFSRKYIVDRVEKWLMVCEEEAWSEKYDRVLNIIQMVAFTETFSRHFSKYGEITDSIIMKDKNTLMPRGFGFVTFADPSIINKVEVKRTVPREEMPSKGGIKTKKIFMGGIPTSLTEDELKEHFSSYGEVVEHQIMFDHTTGRSGGFGFVTFKDEESVNKIISKGKMHDLGKQVVIRKIFMRR